MSRRRRRKTAAPKRSRRLWLGAAVLVIMAAAAGWLVLRSPSLGVPSTAGAALAAYRPADMHALQVSPVDPRTVVFGHHRGMLISRDGGTTWIPATGANGDAMGVALPPGSGVEFAAGHDVFMRSDDGGRTWSSVRPALPGTDIHGFAASAVTPNAFYAYVVGSGLFNSRDNGSTWQKTGDASGGTMSMTVAQAGGRDVVYANTMDGVQRSRDAGQTWEAVREVGTASLNAVGETVYAAAGGLVLVSHDGGTTWERKLFTRGGAVIAAAAPSDPLTVYVLTERLEVWRSADGGSSWERAG